MSTADIVIDGAQGEGGGQILRTALALSLVTQRSFRIDRIRARRKKPGLLRQHLTAVQAAAQVGQAEVTGAQLGASTLAFRPRVVAAGDYTFSVGTAGSATLVLQAILPPLLLASSASRLALEGGTHNPMAPPWDFLARAFLPLLERMGPRVTTTLERHGFYPAGGGQFHVAIEPVPQLGPLELGERGPITRQSARALVANLPRRIAETEIARLRERLDLGEVDVAALELRGSRGPGNIVMLEMQSAQLTEVFTSFGERGVPAARVADQLVGEARRYLESTAPVAEHLTDQLLVPLALAGRGSFLSTRISLHAMTNIDVIGRFLGVVITTARVGEHAWRVAVGGRS